MSLVYRTARADELGRAQELVAASINDLTERHGFGPMASARPPQFQLFSLQDDPDSLWIVAFVQDGVMQPDSTYEIYQGVSVKMLDIITGISEEDIEIAHDFQLFVFQNCSVVDCYLINQKPALAGFWLLAAYEIKTCSLWV